MVGDDPEIIVVVEAGAVYPGRGWAQSPKLVWGGWVALQCDAGA